MKQVQPTRNVIITSIHIIVLYKVVLFPICEWNSENEFHNDNLVSSSKDGNKRYDGLIIIIMHHYCVRQKRIFIFPTKSLKNRKSL